LSLSVVENRGLSVTDEYLTETTNVSLLRTV